VNWLDIVLILIIASSVFSGFARGLARLVVGMVATILAILLAIWFYGSVGTFFQDYVSSRSVSNILGFMVIFGGILIIGSLVSMLLAKLFKWVGLGWLDRLLGGAFGLLRGVLVSIVVIMILMAFSAHPPPQSVLNSRIAPYVVDAASVLSTIAPRELREGYRDSYDRVKKAWTDTFGGAHQKPPTSQF
jgi:membrane protein required for colicin V production